MIVKPVFILGGIWVRQIEYMSIDFQNASIVVRTERVLTGIGMSSVTLSAIAQMDQMRLGAHVTRLIIISAEMVIAWRPGKGVMEMQIVATTQTSCTVHHVPENFNLNAK